MSSRAPLMKSRRSESPITMRAWDWEQCGSGGDRKIPDVNGAAVERELFPNDASMDKDKTVRGIGDRAVQYLSRRE